MRCGRLVCTDGHGNRAPASGPIGHKIAGDRFVQMEKEGSVQRHSGEASGDDVFFDDQHALGKERRELGVGQDAARGCDGAGGVAWRCRVVSHC